MGNVSNVLGAHRTHSQPLHRDHFKRVGCWMGNVSRHQELDAGWAMYWGHTVLTQVGGQAVLGGKESWTTPWNT
ncbi:hypothetical protein, partial [Vibrio vulnificus]|uniref:hypothetical protein n=1 Tax=Vibrio vulnificus TaxID=672 RepID=UPI0039B5F570